MTLGKYIAELDITVTELVNESGLSKQTLNNWFKNKDKWKALDLLIWGFLWNQEKNKNC